MSHDIKSTEFNEIVSKTFEQVFSEEYELQCSSRIIFYSDGFDVEHSFDSTELHTTCLTHQITPEDLVTSARLKVEDRLKLVLLDAPLAVRH